MNTLNMLISLGLGLTVGAIILGAGLLMDHARDHRWQNELDNRPPLPRRIPNPRKPEENNQ